MVSGADRAGFLRTVVVKINDEQQTAFKIAADLSTKVPFVQAAPWDGLFGYDFLRVFTVYLDDERSRIISVPTEVCPSANAARTP